MRAGAWSTSRATRASPTRRTSPACFARPSGSRRPATVRCEPAGGYDAALKPHRGDAMNARIVLAIAIATALLSCLASAAVAQQSDMTFFVTSAGSGKGADLGGLAGADKHCQMLAQSAGAGGKTWHAYLSTQGPGAVNARDRIGGGPWQNAKGTVIAKNVAELHGTNYLSNESALTEKGEMVNGRGDTPNMHDILTGSQPDGTAFAGAEDRTCGNWAKSTQ